MTILVEEKLTVCPHRRIPFNVLKAEILDALKEDDRISHVDEEKKRFARAGVSYSEFKDLVAAVQLKPVGKNNRFSNSKMNAKDCEETD